MVKGELMLFSKIANSFPQVKIVLISIGTMTYSCDFILVTDLPQIA